MPQSNPAALYCLQAFQQSLSADSEAEEKAKAAYYNAIPTFTDANSIQDFVACVAQAMVLKIIPGDEATVLLRAARLATQCLPSPPRRRAGRPRANPKPPLPEN